MRLRPSDIHYSQDSINNYFDARCNHNGVLIGETLDDICEGRTNISNIPRIAVVNRNGKWVTADNRRLWVFRQLERLGKCTYIDVYEGYSIPAAKLTSINGGITVQVRRNPGGSWHRRSASTDNDNSLFRTSYNPERARPYSSPPARVQPTPYQYPQRSYTPYEPFNSISSNSYSSTGPERRKNDSWCNIL